MTGKPSNIASYVLPTLMVVQVCGLAPGECVHTMGDTHVYKNHFDQVHEQLSRSPRGAVPTMQITDTVIDWFVGKYEEFSLMSHDSHPTIKTPIAAPSMSPRIDTDYE